MRAVEVLVNGERRRVFGVDSEATLHGGLVWYGGHDRVVLHLVGVDRGGREYLRWPVPDLGVGDEVTFRLLLSDAVDPPEVGPLS